MVEGNVDLIISRWKASISRVLPTTDLSSGDQRFIEQEARNLLTQLKNWLQEKSRTDIGQRYVALGRKLFSQGIPLCEAHQALYHLKKLIRGHVCHHSLCDTAMEMIHLRNFCDQVELFFDRANYYLLRGYIENMNNRIKELWNLDDDDIEQVLFKNSFYPID